MKPLTHVKVESKQHLTELLNNVEDKIEQPIHVYFHALQNGKNILQCNTFGEISLRSEPIEGSSEEVVKQKEETTSKIDTIKDVLEIIDLKVEDETLTRLVDVFEVVSEKGEDVSIKDIKRLWKK